MDKIILNLVDKRGHITSSIPIKPLRKKNNKKIWTCAKVDSYIDACLSDAALKMASDCTHDTNLYQLTHRQNIILQAFFGCYSYIFKKDCFNDVISIKHQTLMKELNELVCMMPKYNGEICYRLCHKEENFRWKIDDVFSFGYSLTASTLDNFRDKDSWWKYKIIINTLPDKYTKAHDFRPIRHEDNNKVYEGQINFESSALFKVRRIEQIENYKQIILDEIDENCFLCR